MEKQNSRRRGFKIATITALSGAAIGLLSACDGPNYSGKGNTFVVDAKVNHHGDKSITARVYDVKSSEGKAVKWFEDKNPKHQFHNNCNCKGWLEDNTVVGHVLDASGVEIKLSQVPDASCVEISGSLRASSEGKSYEYRPVYATAQLINCPA